MWFLRMLKYILITPFHPKKGILECEADSHARFIRPFAFWLCFIGLGWLYWVGFIHSAIKQNEVGLAVMIILGMKLASFFFFYWTLVVGCLIAGARYNTFHTATIVLALTYIPEYLFALVYFQYPDYYEEAKFLCNLWRGSIVVFGIYITMEKMSLRASVITGVIGTVFLYFANYYLIPG